MKHQCGMWTENNKEISLKECFQIYLIKCLIGVPLFFFIIYPFTQFLLKYVSEKTLFVYTPLFIVFTFIFVVVVIEYFSRKKNDKNNLKTN